MIICQTLFGKFITPHYLYILIPKYGLDSITCQNITDKHIGKFQKISTQLKHPLKLIHQQRNKKEQPKKRNQNQKHMNDIQNSIMKN